MLQILGILWALFQGVQVRCNLVPCQRLAFQQQVNLLEVYVEDLYCYRHEQGHRVFDLNIRVNSGLVYG